MNIFNDPAIRFGFNIAVSGFNSRDMARLNALTADRFSAEPRRANAAKVPHLAALMGLCSILTSELPRAGCTFEVKPMSALELNYQASLGEDAYRQATQQLLGSINSAMHALPAGFLVAANLFDVVHAAGSQEPPKKEVPPSVQKIEIVSQPPVDIASMPTRTIETVIDRNEAGDMSGSRATEADAV